MTHPINPATARRLVECDAFAHRWLCHPDRHCDDGCDVIPDPRRMEQYNEITEETDR